MKVAACALVLMTVPLALGAQEFHAIEGRYSIAGRNLTDPPPGAQRDRVVMFIEGKAAADMFNGMPQKALPNQCADDLLTKTAGNLACSKIAGGGYFCTFAISLHDGRSLNGSVC